MGIRNRISVVSGSSKKGTHFTRGKSGGNWEQELGEGNREQHMGDQKRNLQTCRSKASTEELKIDPLHISRHSNKKDSDNLEAQETAEIQSGENEEKGKWHVSSGFGSETKGPEAHHSQPSADLHFTETVSPAFWVLLHTGNDDLTLHPFVLVPGFRAVSLKSPSLLTVYMAASMTFYDEKKMREDDRFSVSRSSKTRVTSEGHY